MIALLSASGALPNLRRAATVVAASRRHEAAGVIAAAVRATGTAASVLTPTRAF